MDTQPPAGMTIRLIVHQASKPPYTVCRTWSWTRTLHDIINLPEVKP